MIYRYTYQNVHYSLSRVLGCCMQWPCQKGFPKKHHCPPYSSLFSAHNYTQTIHFLKLNKIIDVFSTLSSIHAHFDGAAQHVQQSDHPLQCALFFSGLSDKAGVGGEDSLFNYCQDVSALLQLQHQNVLHVHQPGKQTNKNNAQHKLYACIQEGSWKR